GKMDFVIQISEFNNIDSFENTPVEVRVSKAKNLSITLDKNINTLNGRTVNNADWQLIDHPIFYRFIYIGNNRKFLANTTSSIGVESILSVEEGKEGFFTLKTSIMANSGGQTNYANDNASMEIFYKNNNNYNKP
ncbi:MAG: hypothetical protein OIF50_17985, partial [Flavobacteriaceae bacterium]|nr:hypothetical protein [Flavobacteriaceae bacterium]